MNVARKCYLHFTILPGAASVGMREALNTWIDSFMVRDGGSLTTIIFRRLRRRVTIHFLVGCVLSDLISGFTVGLDIVYFVQKGLLF